MRARYVVSAVVVAASLSPAVALAASGAGPDDAHDAIRTVRAATQDLRRGPAAAEAAGYGQFLTCVREPGQGAMGTHWVNGDLVGDAVLDPTAPEAVMYETKRNGKMRLVGVEYIVFQEAWDTAHPGGPPVLFGQTLHLTPAPNRYGIPAFYELHVWAWRHNPAGTFADWNPKVSCAHAAGTPI